MTLYRFNRRVASFHLSAVSMCGLLIASLIGCGESEDLPQTVPAAGTVMYNDKPVAEAQVTFHPADGSHPGNGRTDAAGKFVLTTFEKEDGALVGEHTVTVQLFPTGGLPGQEVESTGADAIPVKYADKVTTDLKVTLPAEGNKDLTLKLE